MAEAASHSPIPPEAIQEDDVRTLTRADLAEALHRRTGVARGEAAKLVEMVLDEIFEAIVSRDDVKLSSFGAFHVRAKRERQGRNPKTGEEAKITARLVVTFRPSNVLRARVNNGADDAQGNDGVNVGDGEAPGLPAYGTARGEETARANASVAR
ncbi:integration host factor subunit alpha [Methylocystis echinoides]|jgi:integration host factor subunit alpha|uniref:integration host factor subunit alpha n=1 Tax=Methylocystis echinoides TaxID=29468 RepID=UPI003422CF0E